MTRAFVPSVVISTAIRYAALNRLRARHAVPLRGRHGLIGFRKEGAFLAFTGVPNYASKLPHHSGYGLACDFCASPCHYIVGKLSTYARLVGARRAVPSCK